MAKFVDDIVIQTDDEGHCRILFDGKELPFYIARHDDDPILVNGRPIDEFPPGWSYSLDTGLGAMDAARLTITIVAGTIRFQRSNYPIYKERPGKEELVAG